jgi:hypothetical protein
MMRPRPLARHDLRTDNTDRTRFYDFDLGTLQGHLDGVGHPNPKLKDIP